MPLYIREGGARGCTPSFLAETLLLRTGSFLWRRRRKVAAAVVLLQEWLG